MAAITAATLPSGFLKTPSTNKVATISNYVSSIDLHKDDIRDMLVERYGSPRISTDLEFIFGDKRPVAQTEFSHFEEEMIMEEVKFTTDLDADDAGTAFTAAAAGNDEPILCTVDAAYLATGTGNPATGKHSVRVGDIILLKTGQTMFVAATADGFRAPWTAALNAAATPTAAQFVAYPYKNWTSASITLLGGATNAPIVSRENVEFGSAGNQYLSPRVFKYTNNVQIIDDIYAVSGSEMTNQIWIPVKGVGGKTGYLWYYKGELDTRNRFENYSDGQCLVGEQVVAGGNLEGAGYRGTRGYFNDLLTYSGQMDVNRTGGNSFTIASMRAIAKHLNKYRGAKENAFYVGINLSDDVEQAVGGLMGAYSGGMNFGAFNNSEDMMVNLGFSGFKVLNYKFALKNLDMLNDPKSLGATNMNYSYWGMIVPLDSQADAKDRSSMIPSLSIRYKAMDGYSREMEHFLNGGVNGVYTEDLDGLKFIYRTERAFEGMALNRHFLVTGNA